MARARRLGHEWHDGLGDDGDISMFTVRYRTDLYDNAVIARIYYDTDLLEGAERGRVTGELLRMADDEIVWYLNDPDSTRHTEMTFF